MKSVELHVSDASGTSDVVMSLADHVTMGEVFDALALPADTAVDGRRVVAPGSTPASMVLHPGSELSVDQTQAPKTSATAGFVDVVMVAGLDASATARLGPGLFHIAEPGGEHAAAWLVQVDDRHRQLGTAAPWAHHGDGVEVIGQIDGAVLAISRPVDPEPAVSMSAGTTTVHRPPRPAWPAAPRPLHINTAPGPVREPSPLSWATLLAPIPIAVMMAFFFRPIFALFAAMGPVLALGRWWESRRRHRRAVIERDRAIEQLRDQVRDALVMQAEIAAQRCWVAHPHVGVLRDRAAVGSVRLWERRPASDGFMQAMIGVGPLRVPPVLKANERVPAELADLVEQPLELGSVPHVVDLDVQSAVGLAGRRSQTIAVARALIAQLATLHGPADLRLGVLCSSDNADSWEWLKWLPHLDTNLVGHDASDIAATLPVLEGALAREASRRSVEGPTRLLVVDAAGADTALLVRTGEQTNGTLRIIAIAPESTQLPAVCETVVQVAGDGVMIAAAGGVTTGPVAPVGLSRATAEAWARSLTRFRDPESIDSAASSDGDSGFLDLIGYQASHDLARHWADRPAASAPSVRIGHTSHGEFALDLTADGPHALIAGTTGSGKSELLRTLVAGLAAECAPDQLNLVLVDFKGGGAFDAVRELPHVVGVITDLDETLVGRALVSLRAELERRERLFRRLHVSNFEHAVIEGAANLPRLVLVIDEFATLATDYSELMNGIVDLAARGRSLGMHLVLATQRPSGVVDQKIRANTNVRIALRVQDEFDSQDVVGTGEAAAIDRKAPGTAIVRIGGDRPVQVRMAYSGAPDASSQRYVVGPHRLFPAADPAGHCPSDVDFDNTEATQDAPSQLRVLVDRIIDAASIHETAVQPLWAPPLPAHLDWIDLGSRELAMSDSQAGFALGLADIPERQEQRPWRWDPATGPLCIYGASASAAAKALVSLGAAMASSRTPDTLHLYVIDGGSGAGSVLVELPHAGAWIRDDETDRIARAVRLFETTLHQRRSQGQETGPQMVLLVDNLAAILSTHHEVDAAQMTDRLAALARDGFAYGLHLAVTARTTRDVGHRLAQQIPNRLAMDLADPSGFLTLGLRLRDIPALPSMRAIDVRNQTVVQLVEPPDLSGLIADAAAAHRVAPSVPAFPSTVLADQIRCASLDRGVVTVPVGLDSIDLDTAALTLRPNEHVLVVGTPGMGRSSLLDLISQQLANASLPVSVVRVAESIPAETMASLTNPDDLTVLLIDDADGLAPPLVEALEQLLEVANPRVRIVAATRPEGARLPRSWIAQVRASGTGLLIGCSAADADIFRVRPSPLDGCGTVPGRAHLIDRGRVKGIQLALPNAAD